MKYDENSYFEKHGEVRIHIHLTDNKLNMDISNRDKFLAQLNDGEVFELWNVLNAMVKKQDKKKVKK